LLNAKLSQEVLAEYRDRKPWPSLDVAQVEKLVFHYAEMPFVLEKKDGAWHVAGDPKAQVNAETVRDTLDALANLKAERYVVDQGADLKLFGLQPPALLLEAKTESGKRVLHVGRREGESKRYY